MKKLSTLLFLLMLTIGLLAACGEQKEQVKDQSNGNSSKTEETAFPVTIKDALDNEVTIKERPEKIVSLIPSNTEIAFALGLGDEIVGVSNFDNYPEEVSTKEKIGDLNVNIEKVISLQ